LLVANGLNPTLPAKASNAALAGTRAAALAARSAATQTACLQATGTYAPPATPPHIMMIVDENTSYGAADGSPYVIGNSKAPYINNTLIKTDGYTSLKTWYSFEHNSPLDYMDAVSGCDHNGLPQPYADPTLVNELDHAGFTWKAYMDGLAAGQTCYTGTSSGTNNYSRTHNPFVYFNQIISNTAECNANLVPYLPSQFSADLNGATPPDFVWITPNQCNDMHSLCSGANKVQNGDTWLANNLPTVLSSKWYTQGNGIVIITFDEGTILDVQPGLPEGAGGHVATLVISQNSCGSFTGIGNNFATLRGIEEAYGVPLLNNSANATYGDITPAFADGACTGSGSTGTISGQVTDNSTSLPLKNATVTCTCNGGAVTSSDVNGNYSFPNVAVGTYSVTFSDTGYVTQVFNNVAVTSGNTTPVNAALVPSTTSAPTIVQDVGAAAHSASMSFAVTTGSTATGDLLAISTEFDAGSGQSSATVTAVNDNQGDAWTRAVAVNPLLRVGAEIWYSPGAIAGVTSVTVTYSKSVNPVVRFYEIANANALDPTSSGSAKNTTPNTGITMTTTAANDIVIGVIGFSPSTATISGLPSGFTNDPLLLNNLIGFNNAEQSGHEAATATGTFSYSGTLSSSESWAAAIATFE
jgi:Phosphoesterase family/Carboxypeptidase regulatory-like domain